MSRRAVVPVIAVAALVALTVGLSAIVAVAVVETGPGERPPRAAIDVEADPATDRVTVTHVHGDALDPDAIAVRIRIDGRELERQPPVPFFSARGFEPGPTGPFNRRWDGEWRAGESASVRVAATNSPGGIDRGDRVEVDLFVDDLPVASGAA